MSKTIRPRHWFTAFNLLSRLRIAARHISTLNDAAEIAEQYGDDEGAADLREVIEVLLPFKGKVEVRR